MRGELGVEVAEAASFLTPLLCPGARIECTDGEDEWRWPLSHYSAYEDL
jgi:hypothetical protein